MLDNLLTAFSLTINLHHAGFNMIPRLGVEQMLEAFAYSPRRKRA